jgi:hypothetical protein
MVARVAMVRGLVTAGVVVPVLPERMAALAATADQLEVEVAMAARVATIRRAPAVEVVMADMGGTVAVTAGEGVMVPQVVKVGLVEVRPSMALAMAVTVGPEATEPVLRGANRPPAAMAVPVDTLAVWETAVEEARVAAAVTLVSELEEGAEMAVRAGTRRAPEGVAVVVGAALEVHRTMALEVTGATVVLAGTAGTEGSPVREVLRVLGAMVGGGTTAVTDWRGRPACPDPAAPGQRVDPEVSHWPMQVILLQS